MLVKNGTMLSFETTLKIFNLQKSWTIDNKFGI